MFNELRPYLFKTFLKKDADQLSAAESLSDKVLRAYLRMRLKADRRTKRGRANENRKWVTWFSPDAKLFPKPLRR
jgi:hypothetical protein